MLGVLQDDYHMCTLFGTNKTNLTERLVIDYFKSYYASGGEYYGKSKEAEESLRSGQYLLYRE